MQTIEARAILSAGDKTGGVFSRIAAKIREMNVAANVANRTTAATGRLAGAASRANNLVGASAQSAAFGVASRVMAPAVIAAGAAKAWENYAQTELRIKRIGITADSTKEEIAGLHDQLRNTAISTGQSFDQIAKGMESLTAGGMDLKEALPAIPAIAKTAQAAGADVEDMATTTLALNQNLKISTDSMQNAFDILVKGGKAGKFELKDMAKYFPSIAPAAVAVGMKGEAGLMRITAALQTIRAGTGTTEEAADSMLNIFQKMETTETAKKFKKMGVDLPAAMKKARAEGKDLLEVFTDLTEKTLKGDLSKIPQLFSDMQFARGMRALLSYRDLYSKVMGELRASAGSTEQDFNKVMQSPAIQMNKLKEALDKAMVSFGAALEALGKGKDGSGGTSDWIKSIADKVEKDGLVGLLPKDDQAIIKKVKAAGDWITSEKAKIDTWLGDDDGKNQSAPWKRMRLRRLDLERREKLDEDLKGIPSAQDAVTAAIAKDRARDLENALPIDKVKIPQSDPRRTFVPEPLADPRKKGWGSDMPAVQDMTVEAKLTGEAEVKGQTEVVVKVEAGSELLRIVDNVKSSFANLSGILKAGNGPGSSGTSSPDAAPNPAANTGASGKW